MDFWSNLAPKPSQNRAKLGSKRHPKSKQPKSLKILKTHWFFNKKLGSGHQKIKKISLKICQKSIKKVIDDKMDVGMDVGRLLDRFLIDFGTVLGGKMAPSWH